MMQKVHAHGKCILAGEHSIVRGGEAIVLPLLSRNLEISWHREVGKPLEIQPGPLSAPFQTALACALEELNQSLPHQDYSIALASSIPVKAGLGSSAALAVATVRFLEAEGLLVPNPFQLALKIEDLFHGTSSGIDVACALHSRPLLFSKQRPPEQLKMSWQPKLYLADTGLRSSTKDCVRKVAEANRLDLDEKMREAVEIAKQALHSEKKTGSTN